MDWSPNFGAPALRGADGQGRLVQALVVIDVHTRELSDLRSTTAGTTISDGATVDELPLRASTFDRQNRYPNSASAARSACAYAAMKAPII